MGNGRLTGVYPSPAWIPPVKASYPAYTTTGNFLPEVGAAGTGGIEIAHPINGYILRSHLFVPAAAVNTVPLPLIVWINGSGERGAANWIVDGTMKSAASLKSANFGAVLTANLGAYPYFVLIPQMAGGADPAPRYGRTGVLQAIQYVLNTYNIDRTRMHLAGYSYGAVSAFSLAYRFPKGFASLSLYDAVPIQINMSDTNQVGSDLQDGTVYTTDALSRANWFQVCGDIPINYQHGALDTGSYTGAFPGSPTAQQINDFVVRSNDPVADPNLQDSPEAHRPWFSTFAAGGKTMPTTYASTTSPSVATPARDVYVPYSSYDHGGLNSGAPYSFNGPWQNWIAARVRTDYAAF